jgi:hypothetical protein
MNPPKAGERKMLPKMATHGLQIVSPLGGAIDGPGAAALGIGVIVGNGGGLDAGVGTGTAVDVGGRGGGFTVAAARGVSGSGTSIGFSSGCVAGFSTRTLASSSADFSVGGATVTDCALVAGSDSRNSGIGCHADFASLQARSVALKLPSASFARMSDSEKRPASCPFL